MTDSEQSQDWTPKILYQAVSNSHLTISIICLLHNLFLHTWKWKANSGWCPNVWPPWQTLWLKTNIYSSRALVNQKSAWNTTVKSTSSVYLWIEYFQSQKKSSNLRIPAKLGSGARWGSAGRYRFSDVPTKVSACLHCNLTTSSPFMLQHSSFLHNNTMKSFIFVHRTPVFLA